MKVSQYPAARCALRLTLMGYLLFSGWANAGEPAQKLAVGVVESPPFVIRNEGGTFAGISVELWREVANALKLEYEFRDVASWGELVDDTASGRLDVAVAPLTITAEREALVDFSHPYHNTGVSVAVRQDFRRSHLHVLRQVLSSRFLHLVAFLALLLLCVGVIMWLLERRRNAEHFGGQAPSGIGAAFWWAAVTMTTVGFGDKVPRTVAGRALAIVWMFSGIILISSFTAAITSALTLSHMNNVVRGPEDLVKLRTGAVADSASEDFLEGMGLHPHQFTRLEDGLAALAGGRIDAVVADEPLLRYRILADFPRELEVLSLKLEREDYGFTFSPGSRLREPANQVILEITKRPAWDELLRRYLGPEI